MKWDTTATIQTHWDPKATGSSPNVVQDAVIEEHGVLGDDATCFAQGFLHTRSHPGVLAIMPPASAKAKGPDAMHTGHVYPPRSDSLRGAAEKRLEKHMQFLDTAMLPQ